MNTKTILSSFAVALTASLAMAEEPEDKTLPTVEEIEEAWNAQCEFPQSKWGRLPRFFKRVRLHRTDTNALQEVTKAEEFLVSKLLSVEPATTKDTEQVKWTSLGSIRSCFDVIVQWQGERRDTNQLMRIADKLGEFHPLPDIPADALRMAHKVDKYVEYGTNTPPRRFGTISGWGRWKPWFGPTGSRVARIMDFRGPYNSGVAEMRERIFWSFHNVIMEEGYWPSGHSPHPMEENKAVWAEFSRRAKMTEKERAYAERRVHTGEQATTRGVGQ